MKTDHRALSVTMCLRNSFTFSSRYVEVCIKHCEEAFLLTCVRSFVDLEVFAACEHLAAARERTLEGTLSRVDADMVDELVLGLERSSVAGTAEPAACVVRLLRTTHVFNGQVNDRFLYTGERASTRTTEG